MKKNLSIFLYSLGSGGAERVASILVNKLHKKYKITLVLMNDTIFYKVPEEVEFIYLEKSLPFESGIKKLLKLPLLGLKYKKILKEKEIDISLSLMTRPNYINIFAKIFGSGIRTILSERSMFSLYYSGNSLQSLINKKLVRLYNLADLVIPNSKENSLDLIENFKIRTKIKTIYNLIDIKTIKENSQEEIEIEKRRFTFVTIGRLDEGKNHKLLIEALKLSGLDAELWIIGEGELKNNLQLIIDNLKLNDKVKLLGRQRNPYKFITKADCFVFSSNHEGFPNVLLEALSCGLPIISTDCSAGPREILAPKSDFRKKTDEIELAEYGILTRLNDIKAMKKAMQIIYSDEDLRDDYKKKAIIRAKDFDIDTILKEWERVIDE